MGRSLPPDLSFFASIEKIDEEKRCVFGYASTETRDRQNEIVKREAIEAALPGYMLWKNVREMHQPSAVGTAIEAKMMTKGLWFGAKVVDDRAWKKVKDRVYKGFSIGGRVLARDPDDPTIITKVDITEISLVDRPANPDAKFELVKRAGDIFQLQPQQYWGCGCADHQHLTKAEASDCMTDRAADLRKYYAQTDDGALMKFNPNHGEHGYFSMSSSENDHYHNSLAAGETHAAHAAAHEEMARSSGNAVHQSVADQHHKAAHLYRAAAKQYVTSNPMIGDVLHAQAQTEGNAANRLSRENSLHKRDFTEGQREQAADAGKALPDGSFPIVNKGDLRNAIHAVGRAKNFDAAKAHIIERAKALGAEAMLPEEWSKGEAAADLSKRTPRAIHGGQFAGHLKSSEEAAKLAGKYASEAANYGKLAKTHETLADESEKAGNPFAARAHRTIAKSHKALATRHETLADRYTRLAAKHGEWAQKGDDMPTDDIGRARAALAEKRARLSAVLAA